MFLFFLFFCFKVHLQRWSVWAKKEKKFLNTTTEPAHAKPLFWVNCIREKEILVTEVVTEVWRHQAS